MNFNMKMAKADHAEWQKCMDFANNLEDEVGKLDDEKLGRWVRKNYVWLGRVIYGFRVLVDNACDPTKDTLEWRPELAEAMALIQAREQPELLPDATPKTDEIVEYLKIQFPATEGHIPIREKISALEMDRDRLRIALEGMSELCGNYFDESQLVCDRDKEIWKLHLEAIHAKR